MVDLSSWMPDVSLVCKSILLSSVVGLALHIIFSNPKGLISGIPNSIGPWPGNKKNLYLTTLSLCLIQTEQMPNVLCLICYIVLELPNYFVAHNTFIMDF